MKMKFILSAFMAALFAGCTSDSAVPDATPVPFGISSASLHASVATKSGTATPLTSGSIGVYRTPDAGSGYSSTEKLFEYAYNATKWTPSTILFLNNNNAKICAFYPYSYVVPASFDPAAVSLTYQKYDPLKDFVYTVNADYNNVNHTADFTLGHAYSMITFSIKKDAAYTGAGVLTSIKLTNPALVQSNTINITNGSYGASPVNGDISYSPAFTATATAADSKLLLPPTTADMANGSNVALSVVLDGNTLSVNIPADKFSYKFIAGSNYQVTLTIKGTAIVINSVKIADWNDVSVPGEYVPEA